ncbi:LysR family transcriptional regulator [Alkalibacter mobilis]|uniref:LysR family transcriptional regulator n=1 Tax=Alkalibacter mobilis TaxID=2787712 RepID=UPI0018A0BB00|nr:LysR family transcriptional regulator [Alkalibacter mobilis]MBF7097238.1 LysR family transcriptional regulator [Alkalibacter mobilis]
MDIEYLRECIILAKYLNFTAAAEIVHITQPVLSRHIKDVEEKIGVKLFVRTKHSVHITEEGKYFIELAEVIVKTFDQMMDKMESIKTGFSSNLQIGILYYAVDQYLSPVLDKFKDIYPNVNINIFPSYPIPVIENLLSGNFDLGIILKLNFLGSERLEFQVVKREQLIVAIRHDHILSKNETLCLEDLNNEIFLDIDDFFFNSYSRYIYQLCNKYGLIIEKRKLVNNLEAAILAAQSGEGILILPSQLRDIPFSKLKYIPISNEDCFIDMAIAHKPENQNIAIAPFIDLCKKVLK